MFLKYNKIFCLWPGLFLSEVGYKNYNIFKKYMFLFECLFHFCGHETEQAKK